MNYSHGENKKYDPFKYFQDALQHLSSDHGIDRNDKHFPDSTKKQKIENSVKIFDGSFRTF